MAARLTTYVVVAIVSATLIAGLIVGAQRDDSSGPVDLIIHNARVYTADAHGTMAQAVAVRGNTILRVGSDRDVMRYRRPQTEVIDARGAAVLPGFNDAHASLVAAGLAGQAVDLTGASTLDDIQQRISGWAETHPHAAWIKAHDWPASSLTDVTKSQLDAIVADRPVMVISQDETVAWVNSAALHAAGITRKASHSENAEIVRDRRGDPTGLLRGSAIDLVRRAIPPPSRDDRAQALSTALDDAARRGITSVQDFVAERGDIELYDGLRTDARAHEDVRVYIGVPVSAGEDAAAGLDELATRFPDDPSIKTGVAYVRAGASPAQLTRAVREIDSHKWQVAIEASDAASVHDALDAFETAARTDTERSADRRHRLEGVRDVLQDDLAAFKHGRWIALLFPSQLPGVSDDGARADAPSLDVLHWPARSVQGAGAHLAFGSDEPDRPGDPLGSISAVVARHTAPDEELTLKSAINAWTSGAAWASFDEHRKGTLEPGMLADLIVLSDDIFKMPPDAIASATVDVTVIDGRIVYRRKTS